MHAALAMSFSILMWSLYPLWASLALAHADPFSLMFMAHVFAFIVAAILCAALLWRQRKMAAFWQVQKNLGVSGWLLIAMTSLTSALSHSFFLMSLTLASKAGVSLVFELWPIVAMFFTPILTSRTWTRTTWKDYALGIVSLIGVCLIILGDKDLMLPDRLSDISIYFASQDSWVLLGYILALGGCYLTALQAVLRMNYADVFKTLDSPLIASFLSVIYTRGGGAIFLAFIVLGLQGDFNFGVDAIGYMALVGAMVFALAAGAYTYALLNARHSNIHIFYYLAPAGAVLWLYLFRETEITMTIIIGGAMVVGANIILALKNRKN